MHIWDYNIDANWKPKTHAQWEWFLVRKINYDDFTGLRKATIKKYFPAVKHLLDPGKRAMLEHFFINETD